MQVEGAYGVVKQNLYYTRLRRTGFDSAKTEIGLTFLAYNIRKYFSFLNGKKIKPPGKPKKPGKRTHLVCKASVVRILDNHPKPTLLSKHYFKY